MSERRFHVYMMTNCSRHPIYTGVTGRLMSRRSDHRRGKSFYTHQYNLQRLVYFEEFTSIRQAIAREKQIKRWRREKKMLLIERSNPQWEDLGREWGTEIDFEVLSHKLRLVGTKVPRLAAAAPLARDDSH